jgi:hypothetical protein
LSTVGITEFFNFDKEANRLVGLQKVLCENNKQLLH